MISGCELKIVTGCTNSQGSALSLLSQNNCVAIKIFVIFDQDLKTALKESPIYINDIVFKVAATYSKLNASAGYDLILAIVIAKHNQIC